jgi:hypothetical protein
MARYAPDAEIRFVVASALLQRHFVVNLVAHAHQTAIHASESTSYQDGAADIHPFVTTNTWGASGLGFQYGKSVCRNTLKAIRQAL